MLKHRHGGTITKISSIGHDSYKGVAEWFFLGDVKWEDGKESKETRIAPFALGHDGTIEGQQECDALHGKLSDYLGRVGAWHDMKHKRDGRCYSWTPKKPAGQEAV